MKALMEHSAGRLVFKKAPSPLVSKQRKTSSTMDFLMIVRGSKDCHRTTQQRSRRLRYRSAFANSKSSS
jgi:hypothetical protein